MVVVGAMIVVGAIAVGAGATVVTVGATIGVIVVVNVLVVVMIVGATTGATEIGVGATGVTVGAMMGVIVVGKLLVVGTITGETTGVIVVEILLVIGATTGATIGVIVVDNVFVVVVTGVIVVTGASVLRDGCFSVVKEVPVAVGTIAVPVFSGVRVAPDFVAGLMIVPVRLFVVPPDSSTPDLVGAISAPFFIPVAAISFLTVEGSVALAPPSSFSRAPGLNLGSSLP